MNTSLEHVKLLMREIGPVLNGVYEINEIDDKNWTIEYEDTTEIQLEWLAESERLLLNASCGWLKEGREQEMLTMLMSFNMLAPDTGGARIGLIPENNQLVLMRDLAANELTLQAMSAAVQEFFGLMLRLEEMVASDNDMPASMPSASALIQQNLA